MNKAKIFLTALTVMTVVSGALAYKAKTISIFGLCATIELKCVVSTFQSFATTNGGTTPVSFDVLGAPCKQINGIWTCTTLVRISI